jgi:predicted aldo/keto reductase-like oxidoreductase
MSEQIRASVCIQCRECGDRCPQSILISEWVPLACEVLGEGRPYKEWQIPG